MMKQDRIADALLPPSAAPGTRLGHALLWQPLYVKSEKILWHVPFLFWLIETTKPRLYVQIGVGEGIAYMAACQAVHRLRMQSQCYAVGDWENDNGELPERLAARNADLYGDFSQILDNGIEKSAGQFDDESIDLMMVDLTESPRAVAILQDIWLPKLSRDGILLLNGIDRGNESITILTSALAERSPTIQMPGGDGLLVVLPEAPAEQSPANVAALSPGDPAHKLIVQMFTRLGAGAFYESYSRANSDRVSSLEDRLRTVTDERDSLMAQLSERERQYDARHRKVANLQASIFDLQLALEAARTELESSKKKAEALGREIGELTEQSKSAAKDHQRVSGELAAERAKSEKTAALLREAQTALEEARRIGEAALADLKVERSSRLEADQQRAKLEEQAQAMADELGRLTSASENEYDLAKELVATLEENENLIAALTVELRSARSQSEGAARLPADQKQANSRSSRSGRMTNLLGLRKVR